MRDISESLKPEFYRTYCRAIALYEITIDDTVYKYAANNEDIGVYTALAIKRSAITSEEGTIVNELEIGLDNVDLEFKNYVASGEICNKLVTIKLAFLNASKTVIGTITLYSGYMDEPKGDEHWVTMTVRPFPLLEREYPKRIFQIGCNWTFGNTECGINRALCKVNTVVGSGSDEQYINVASTGHDDDYFVPGYIQVLEGDYKNVTRPIKESTATKITLRVHLEEPLEDGTAILIQKTCSKNPEYCEDEFDNYANYGGFPDVPKQPTF